MVSFGGRDLFDGMVAGCTHRCRRYGVEEGLQEAGYQGQSLIP